MDLGDTRFSIGFQNTRDTRILTKGLEDARFSLKKYDPFGSPFEPLLELSFEFSFSRDFKNYAYFGIEQVPSIPGMRQKLCLVFWSFRSRFKQCEMGKTTTQK